MKFDDLIEYNTRNIFLEKSCTVCFYCMLTRGLSKHIGTKLQATGYYLIETFLKIQKEV